MDVIPAPPRPCSAMPLGVPTMTVSLSTAVKNPVDGSPEAAQSIEASDAERAAIDLWTRAVAHLKNRLSRHTYQTYFEPIRPVSLVGDELTLAHSSKFMIDWVRDNLLDVLMADLLEQLGGPCKVQFVVRERPSGDPEPEAAPPSDPPPMQQPSISGGE